MYNPSNFDSDFNSVITWQEALDLFMRLCANKADISYGDRLIKTYRLPTLELRLDDPASLLLPVVKNNLHHWKDVTLNLGEANASCSNDLTYSLPQNGAAATAYAAFLSFVELMDALMSKLDKSCFQWAWCSIPIAPFCDDADIQQKRVRAAFEKGAVTSIWLRHNDDQIKQALASLYDCGQLRLHNLTSANTFVTGCEDEEGLAQAFGLL